MSRTSGLSAIEIIVVLAILAILLGMGYVSFLRYQRNLVLQEAATQVASDLLQLRSQARRTSSDYEFTATQNTPNYRRGPAGSPTNTTLPAGVSFVLGQAASFPSTLTFRAPDGTVINAGNSSFGLLGPGGNKRCVNVIGITGKVIIRAC